MQIARAEYIFCTQTKPHGRPGLITVTLENQDQGDLFVSITDLNQAGEPEILKKQRINRGESRLLDIQEDGKGSGKIRWLAQRTDHPQKTAQHVATPETGDTVEITSFFG